MRRAAPLLALLFALSSCAPSAVRVERYRGAYSTHFEGIPDQAEICAVVRNLGTRPVEWLELRLDSTSQLADAPATWKSTWVYRGRIEAGERIALRFENAPMADRIEVALARFGRDDRAPKNGRPLQLTSECSEDALRVVLYRELEQRSAPGIEVREAVTLGADAPGDDLLATR